MLHCLSCSYNVYDSNIDYGKMSTHPEKRMQESHSMFYVLVAYKYHLTPNVLIGLWALNT